MTDATHGHPVETSVDLPAHNHQASLSEALDSALMQQAEFELGVVVGKRLLDRRLQVGGPARTTVWSHSHISCLLG